MNTFKISILGIISGILLSACGGGGSTATPKAWGNPVLLESRLDTAGNARVAMNGKGDAIATWLQKDVASPNSYSVYARHYDGSTATWSAAQPIENQPGSAGYQQVAIDPNGNALVVWSQQPGSYENIYASRYNANTASWELPVLLEGSTGAAIRPQVAMDANGNALAVWDQNDGVETSIYTNRFDATSGLWGTAAALEVHAGPAGGAQVAVAANGDALAVWLLVPAATGHVNVYAKHFDAGTKLWTGETILDGSDYDADPPEIAIDANGNGIAVWPQNDGSYRSIYANRYDANSNTWSTAQLIENMAGDAISPEGLPQVAMDTSGNALAVWSQQPTGGNANIYANRYDAGAKSWGSAMLLESSSGYASLPQVAIDGNGDAQAVWVQNDGTYNSIYANRYAASAGSWASAELIETRAGAANVPDVAVDANGNALAVWEQVYGTTTSIYANTFR